MRDKSRGTHSERPAKMHGLSPTTEPRKIVEPRAEPVRGVHRGPPSGAAQRAAPGARRSGRVLAPDGIVDTRKTPVPIIRRKGAPRPRPAARAPGGAAAAAGVTYHNGPLIANVEIIAFYWGSAWSDPGSSGLASQLNQFFADFTEGLPNLGSPIDQLAEYNVPGYSIGRGSFVAPGWFVAPPVFKDPGSTVDDADIQAALPRWVTAFNLTLDPNSLLFVFTPPNVTVTSSGSASCSSFCGYHGNANGTHYAVMPYPCTQGCTGSLTIFDALTLTASHEISEAITDPEFTGWWDSTSTGNEIGDFCGWTPRQFGPYIVQEEWSNAAGGCV